MEQFWRELMADMPSTSHAAHGNFSFVPGGTSRRPTRSSARACPCGRGIAYTHVGFLGSCHFCSRSHGRGGYSRCNDPYHSRPGHGHRFRRCGCHFENGPESTDSRFDHGFEHLAHGRSGNGSGSRTRLVDRPGKHHGHCDPFPPSPIRAASLYKTGTPFSRNGGIRPQDSGEMIPKCFHSSYVG